jgi:hypothetical protein
MIRLLAAPMEETLRVRAASGYYREHYGLAKPPPQNDLRAMASALATAANGDRQITLDERNWIVGYFAAKGYPAEVVREAMGVAPVDLSSLPDLMDTGTLRKSARILIYDAIRVASVDGYKGGEEKAVREVAYSLGLDGDAVAEIESLVREEDDLRRKRVRVLMPEGHPYLDDRYDNPAT